MSSWTPSEDLSSIYYDAVGEIAQALENKPVWKAIEELKGGSLLPEEAQFLETTLDTLDARVWRAIDQAVGPLQASGREIIEIRLNELAMAQANRSNLLNLVRALRSIVKGDTQLDALPLNSIVHTHINRAKRKHGAISDQMAAREANKHLRDLFSKGQLGPPRDHALHGLIVAIGRALRDAGIPRTANHYGHSNHYDGNVIRVLAVLHQHFPRSLGQYTLNQLFERAKEQSDQSEIP